MSVLAEFDQIQKIKVAKEKENMQRIEITVKSNNQEAVSISSEKMKVINHASRRSKRPPLTSPTCINTLSHNIMKN